jgi:hypothetical protein
LIVATEGSRTSDRFDRFDGATVKLLESFDEFAIDRGNEKVAPDAETPEELDGVDIVEPGRFVRKYGKGATSNEPELSLVLY